MTAWTWAITVAGVGGVWFAGVLFATFVLTPLLYGPQNDKRPPWWYWLMVAGWPVVVPVMLIIDIKRLR